jgi:Domain of unknown function (DUF4328)/Protein of unknown function (DUF2510)
MSDETVPDAALPLAGWYPDPEAAGKYRWWDGSAWSEHRAEAPRAAPTRGPGTLGSGFPVLTSVLVWLIAVQLAAYAVMAVLYVWGMVGPFDGAAPWDNSPLAYDIVEGLAAVGAGLPFFGSVVVWCIWQYRLARATLPGATRRSPGMHAGSWFIPFVMLWFPFQNMRDLWKVHVYGPAGGLLGLWWTVWLVTNLTAMGLMKVIMGRIEMSFRGYNLLSLVDAVMWITVSALALVIVRRLSAAALQHEAAGE